MTVHKIAELAGVSIGTVDRVLHNRGRVSAATKARIEAIIEKYQFHPNPIAQRLKRNRPFRFCVLIPRRDQDAGYWGQIIEGLETGNNEIRSLGVELTIIEYDRYRFQETGSIMNMALSEKPDGMIIPPIACIKHFLPRLRKKQIPCIFIDTGFPGMIPLCTISQNPVQGGYLAGRLMHLFAGTIHRPVAILDAHGDDYHITRRRDGFVRYAEEHQFPVIVKEYSEEGELSERSIARFLRENPNLAGIFITNSLAHRVAQTVKKSNSGKNCFIIGYDLVQNNRQLLKEGCIDAIISQRPGEQGRLALINLYRHIVLAQEIPPTIEMPLDIYIKENSAGL
jgi:LacI family transcriptional regulator